MKLTGMIRPTATQELVAEGVDLADARANLDALIPDGHELVQAHNRKMPEGVQITGVLRASRTERVEADGPTYPASVDALRSQVPDGCQLLNLAITT
jgi:hypothetical protein